MRYINDLREGENIVEFYLCKQKQTLKSKTGKNYYSLKLQDKTGMTDGKVWDLNNGIQSFEENDVIKVDASVITYNNEIQLNIKRIRRARDGEYDPMELIPSTDKDVNDLFAQVTALIDSIENEYIKTLLENIFIKNENVKKEFKMHSAAKAMHHNYMGGLIEHTLSVAKLCDYFSSHYQGINRDLLIST
ncbi:MAG: hydrolase, partial [Firmicutes bacterium]|nr:hydrolase [Bacillota bacterium]